MDFLTMDKIFVLDNFSFVQDKKYFVWADGQGNSISRMTTYCINVNQLPVQKFVGAFSFCIGFLQQGRPKFHFGCTSHIDGNSFSNWQSIVNDDFCQRKDVNLLLSTIVWWRLWKIIVVQVDFNTFLHLNEHTERVCWYLVRQLDAEPSKIRPIFTK